ncbi:MAG: FecR domain-containing protein [Bacteroidota bacterium]
MNKDTFIQDWMEGKITPEQLEELKSNPEYEGSIRELNQILKASSQLTPPKKKDKQQAWAELSDRITEGQSEKAAKVIKLNRFIKLAVAVTVILLLTVYLLLPSTTTFTTLPGEQLTYTLPNGTKVTLNAASSISFSASQWDTERKVDLTGEAYFDVTNGKPFTVATRAGNIEVLGTRFNAYHRSGTLRVSCFEGKVSVSSKSNNTVLRKGQMSEIKNNVLEDPKEFDVEKAAAWRTGEFYYENTPLTEVVYELERQFNVEININLNSKRHYTGYFSNKDLDEALKLVLLPMSLKYEKAGSTIEVK